MRRVSAVSAPSSVRPQISSSFHSSSDCSPRHPRSAFSNGSLSVFPLLLRTVRISRVDAQDVDFRLRPRPKPEKDYSAIRAFFPPIPGREPEPAAAPKALKAESGWKVAVDGIRANGDHNLWIFQVQGKTDTYMVSFLDHVIRCDCPNYHNRWNRDYGSFLCYHIWACIFKIIELRFKDFFKIL